MQVYNTSLQIPTYSLEPDELMGSKQLRIYNYDGSMPGRSDLLVPHRKDYYLLVFIRQAESRQWIDMVPYTLKANTFYFTAPGQIIVKEGINQLWSTGIAFTDEFLALQENASLRKLPLIQNPYNGHELQLKDTDVRFVEDLLTKICLETQQPGDFQQRMMSAYITVLLTYMSRLYTEQFTGEEPSADKLLLRQFQAKIEENFWYRHEVAQYASMLHLSAGHLSEIVKRQSGKPAIKHIHERLVLEARRLLFHTQHSLKEIAFSLGFAEASYFTRFFKRETGQTPADYRATIRKMYQ
ncbi:AraC family transcriptional regulator [Spirosoma sp. 209]|uniref:AraC family transcriptional regulator n=1 Tax=Spirosoma sp. 209 TaxID=1955701 RepID=UPI00098D1708|nr:AraC family transcriptional regulator [Spirosoma sp. 209]